MENAQKILEWLNEFGFGELKITEEDLTTPSPVIQLGQEPQRINILTDISAVDFDKAYKNRILISVHGQEMVFIGRKDLMRKQRNDE